jgi:hypothetical protein
MSIFYVSFVLQRIHFPNYKHKIYLYLKIRFRRFRKICQKRLLASSCLSVCTSVRSHVTTRLPLDGILCNLILAYFSKICRERSIFTKIRQEWRVPYMKTNLSTFLIISRWILLRMRNVWDKTCRENQNALFIFNHCFRKLCRLRSNVKKFDRSRQTADGNKARELWMLPI